MKTNYFYKSNEIIYKDIINNDYQRDTPLEFDQVENGLVLPLTKNENSFNQSGGIVDKFGNVNKKSLTLRNSPFKDTNYPNWYVGLGGYKISDFNNLAVNNKKVIFLGAFPLHYGHFITEGLARLWIAKIFNPKDYLFIYISSGNVKSHYLDFFSEVGIPKDNILRILNPIRFRSIIVPEASIRLNDYYHNDFRGSVALNYSKQINLNTRKIFFTKGNKNGRSFGDFFISQTLKMNNYELVNPEKLSLIETVKLLSKCSHFAASSGTNIHNSIFLRKGAHIICFNRSSHIHPLQCMIDNMNQLNAIYVDCHLKFDNLNFSGGPYFFWPSKEFFEFSLILKKRITFFKTYICYLFGAFGDLIEYIIFKLLRKFKRLFLRLF